MRSYDSRSGAEKRQRDHGRRVTVRVDDVGVANAGEAAANATGGT